MIIKKKIKDNSENLVVEEKLTSTNSVAKEDKVDLFDLDNIDFAQRQERRRGDRRRGYRRIDDRNLISRAHEEAESIKEASAKEGYKAGLEQANRDLQSVKLAFSSFFSAKEVVFEKIAPDILDISIDIARKIVKKEIEQNPEIVLETIMDVLRTISKEESRIGFKVSPQQVSFVKDSIPGMIMALGIDAKVNVIPDDSLEEGSCIVYTHNGVVDATVNTQLELLKEALKGI